MINVDFEAWFLIFNLTKIQKIVVYLENCDDVKIIGQFVCYFI